MADQKDIPDEGKPFNEEEQAIVDKVTAELGEEKMAKVDEMLLFQFIRGYSYEGDNWAAKVVEMLTKALEWREKEDVDNICRRELEKREEFTKIWETVCCGSDKQGRLVVVERLGKIDPTKLLEHFNEEQVIMQHVRTVEEVRLLKWRAKREHGHHLYKIISILDLDGFGWAHMGTSFYGPIKKATEIDGWFYPESLYKMYVINSPWVFKTLWAVVKPWLHPITQEKITITGSDYLKKLEEIGVTKDQLPEFIGGTGTDLLPGALEELKKLDAEAAGGGGGGGGGGAGKKKKTKKKTK